MQIYQYLILLPFITSACVPLPLQKYSPLPETDKTIASAPNPTHVANHQMQLSEIEMISSSKPIQKVIRIVNYIQPFLSYSEVTSVAGSKQPNSTHQIAWKSALFPQDFSYIEKLCQQYNLLKQTHIKIPKAITAFKSCNKNTEEIKIYLRSQSGQENSFIITSEVLCASKYIPLGITKLMGELDALISKYQPPPNTQIAFLGFLAHHT